jgi:hypothetical protein
MKQKLIIAAVGVVAVLSVLYGAGTTVNGTRIVNGDLTVKGTCTGCGAAASSTILAPVALASIAAAGTAGAYYPTFTDEPLQARDTGAAWNFYSYALAGPLTLPPTTTGSWTWGSTQGTAAVTANGASNAGGAVWNFSSPANSGDQIRFFYKNATYPVATFTFSVCQIVDATVDNTWSGIAFSDGTKYLNFGIGIGSGGVSVSGTINISFTSQTGGGGAFVGTRRSVIGVNRPLCLKVQDDLATNITAWYSDDVTNLQKYQLYQAGRTSVLTPTRIGIVQDVNNSSWGMSSKIIHMVGTGGFTP